MDEDAAADVVERVLRAAAGERLLDRERLVERAIRLGVTANPARAFAAMDPSDREAVALARLAGCSAGDVAATLGIDIDEAKRSMLRGLRQGEGRRPGMGLKLLEIARRESRRLGTVAEPELLEHVAHVRLDRGLADHEPLRDLAVPKPLREQARAPRARAR